VVEWRDQNHPDLNADEVEFVDASVRREEREAQARRRRQRRTVTVVGAAAVLALVLAAVALIARNEAAEQRAEASQQEDTAEARRLMASSAAVLDADPELALLLATEAAERLPGDVEAETALHAATVASRTLLALTWPDERIFSTVPDLTEDGSTLAWVGGPGAVVEVRDVDSGALRWRYEFPTSNPADLHMAPQFIRGDRELMVTVQYSPQDPGTATDPPDVAGVHVFDVETGELVRTLPSSECGAWLGAGGNWSAVVSSNSDDYALWYQYSPTTISEHGCVPLGRGVSLPIDVVRVDVETGEHRPVVSDHVVNLHLHTAVSGDGRVVSVAAPGARSRVIDVESGEVVLELPEVSTTLGPTALSPDGSLVAFVAEQNHRLAIYDVATGARVSTIAGHRPTSQISNAYFSADGTRLHTGGADGTARVWSVDTGEQLDVIGGLSAGVNETRMSGDGTRLAMSMFGREVRVVDLTPGGQPEVAVVDECGDGSAAGRVRNGGGLDVRPGRILSVLSCGGDATPGRAFVTDATTGDVTATVPALGESVAWSDDGTLLVTQEWRREGDVVVGGRLTVWDAGTGEAIATLDGLCEAEWTHRLSDVDRSIAFSSTPAQACRPAPDPPFAAANYRMRISPDDAHVAAIVDTGTNGFIVLADTEGAGDVHVLDGGVMTFARGGSELIVVRGPEGQMIAYDSESATPIREGPSIGRPIVDVQYVPDRDELITVGSPNISDSDIIRIDAESLEQVGVIEDTHDSPVSDLHLSPDLGVLATGGIDGHAKVWDMDSGQLLHDVSVADEPVVAVAVSEDGGTLYTATESGPVLGWVLDSGELLDIARSRSERGFSVAECVLYFPDEDCPVYEAADRGAASG
jgi:WD40 repeat protein